jgi:hypothetical protein
VHIAWDRDGAAHLAEEWSRLGLTRVPLELVDCPDRRVARATLEYVASELADGQTEVTVVLPHRVYRHAWQRFLHDRTGEEIAEAMSGLEHANVTVIPYRIGDAAPIGAAPEVAVMRRQD